MNHSPAEPELMPGRGAASARCRHIGIVFPERWRRAGWSRAQKAGLPARPLVLSALILIAGGLPCAGAKNLAWPAQDSREDWRAHPPAAGPPKAFKLPRTTEMRLGNGITLVVVADRRAPIVTLDVGVPAGDADDPAGEPGLAEATADLLTEGAGGLSSEQIANEVERLGGQISSESTADYSEVSCSFLAENTDRMIELAATVLLKPDFPDKEVALYKKNRMEKVTADRQDPAFVVGEEFNKLVYGPHPYGRLSPTRDSVRALGRARIQDFYRKEYGPRGSYVVAVGDFDSTQMEARLRSAFEGWQAVPAASRAVLPEPKSAEPGIYLVDRPGSDQADIRVGNVALRYTAPDYVPLWVASSVLGGGASSRLFQDLREQKGYTYDISSSARALKRAGTFFVATETRNEVVVPAIREILAELDRIRRRPVPNDELQSAKNLLNGAYSLTLSTQGGLAEQILKVRMMGLSGDYLDRLPAMVESVTPERIQKALDEGLRGGRQVIVVVGDASKLKAGLSGIAKVTVLAREAAGK